MLAVSFPSFFLEQGFDRFLVGSIVLAGLFLLTAVASARILCRWLPPRPVHAVVISAGFVLALWAVGITLFEAAALWYRVSPHGSGAQKMGADRDAFLDQMRFAFFALYAGLVVLALGCGLVFARMGGRSRIVSGVAASALVLLFLALTLPYVEFSNSCNVGQSLVLDENDC